MTFIQYLIFACSDYWRKHNENEKDYYFSEEPVPRKFQSLKIILPYSPQKFMLDQYLLPTAT
jgi:hypothetical protein